MHSMETHVQFYVCIGVHSYLNLRVGVPCPWGPVLFHGLYHEAWKRKKGAKGTIFRVKTVMFSQNKSRSKSPNLQKVLSQFA